MIPDELSHCTTKRSEPLALSRDLAWRPAVISCRALGGLGQICLMHVVAVMHMSGPTLPCQGCVSFQGRSLPASLPWLGSLTKHHHLGPGFPSTLCPSTDTTLPACEHPFDLFLTRVLDEFPTADMNVSITRHMYTHGQTGANTAIDLGVGFRQAHHAGRASAQEPAPPRQGYPGAGSAAGQAREAGKDPHRPDPPERPEGPDGCVQSPGQGFGSYQEVCCASPVMH